MIDWSGLKPYERDKNRSFEELCYQIAKGLYGEKGRFTSIDDSGGGDGVEFYLTLPNGEQWGWQAKFYYPDRRLSVGGRKTSIKKSLQRACDNHPRLTKWFLCTPTDLTTDEQTWFDEKLARARINGRPTVPEGRNIKLEKWGESDFIAWMSEPRFAGKQRYFFGELELSLDWFRSQVEKQTAALRGIFNPQLHTETHIDARIHGLLGDEVFASHITDQVSDVRCLLEECKEAINDLRSDRPHQVDWMDAKDGVIAACEPLQNALEEAVAQLEKACGYLNGHQLDVLRQSDWSPVLEQMEQAYEEYRKAESAFDLSQIEYSGKDEVRDWTLSETELIVHRPASRAISLMDALRGVFDQISYTSQTELHILGNAGVGKTHIACHICHERLDAGLPALMVLGSQFTSDRPLSEQLRGILDIPPAYSWSDFLHAIAAAAETYQTRIPLIIDGLDTATSNGIFSGVWRQGLPGLGRDTAQSKDVVLITTCRTSYLEAIWPDGIPENAIYAYGFDAYSVEVAIERYFDWYKIRADLTAAPLSQFEHPIYLKIFCESKNHSRQEEKHIYVGEQTLFEVFDEYLDQCNRAVCDRLDLHPSSNVVTPALNLIAAYLWDQRNRNMPLAELANSIDEQPLKKLKWPSSSTKAILDEGLLVCRDWRGDGEVVFFTYDLLGGYLIAQYLLQEAKGDIEGLVQSDAILSALFSDDFQSLHPMHSDISRCLAALLPARTGKYLHDLSDNTKARSIGVQAIFEIAPSQVNQDCVTLIASLFEDPSNRRALLKLTTSTLHGVDHPLNAFFWSEQLRALPMSERDVSWTEYVRENVDHFEKILAHFEAACRSDETLSEAAENRLRLLAEYITWVLTSTVRPLRDKATRALYWYGRRFPEQFLDLVLGSLEINDPYVSERMLAAAYGIAMARQYDFDDPHFATTTLPVYGRSLYEAVFRPNAPHGTTHILARDYARYTVEMSLIHHPDLLTTEEKERLRPPFTNGGLRDWGKNEDRNEDEYREGNAPIQLDFDNHTLGRLVKDRANYDYEHEEYRLVRANIFWRIYDLGYSLETFGEIDKRIVRWGAHYSRSANGRKTDRYGKKYSWIAFYELAGFRKDQGLLPGILLEVDRILGADIDPSFPLACQEYELVRTDFLGDCSKTVEEWVLHGGLSDLNPYLIVDEILGEKGPWVLLDGYIKQENGERNRSRVIFPCGFIVKSEEVDPIEECLKQHDFRRLPEAPEDYYTYAGEIPWCDTYPYNELTELSFVVSTRTETDSEERLVLVRDSKPISADEQNEFWQSISDQVIQVGNMRIGMGGVAPQEVIDAKLKKMGLEARTCKVPVGREVHDYQVFQVLIPVRESHWEDYHSVIVPGRSISTPAKEITENLDLCGQPQTFALFEKDGRCASITFCYGEHWHTFQGLTYLRQDLLERYLAQTDCELVWAIWGERQFYADQIETFQAYADSHEHSEVFHVFQDVKVYRAVKKNH